MRLIVVDANVVVSAALKPTSTPALALLAVRTAKRLALSTPILDEYREVLSRAKFAKLIAQAKRDAFLSAVVTDATFVEASNRVQQCRDPGDDKYLELAATAQAAAIVSGDLDLLSLDPWRGVRILTPSAFLSVE